MAVDNDEFAEAFDGQRKLDQLFQRLQDLPLDEEILTIDKDQSGKAIELRDHDGLVARWAFSAKSLQFSETAPGSPNSFETRSMDAAFEHTRKFLRSRKRGNVGKSGG